MAAKQKQLFIFIRHIGSKGQTSKKEINYEKLISFSLSTTNQTM